MSKLIVALVGIGCLTGLLWGGEQIVHQNKERVPVVTLSDPDRKDPYEYRFVIINSRNMDFSILVDRYNGRVFQCLGIATPLSSNGMPESCVLVYDGPVIGGKK